MIDTRAVVVPAETARPGDLIGWRRNGAPIRLIGGAADGDVTAGDDEDSDEDEDTDDTSANDGWKPPSREEWDRQQAAVRRNNQENKKHRLLRRRLTDAGIDPDTDEGGQALADLLANRGSASGGGGKDGDDKPAGPSAADVRRAETRAAERAAARVEARYKAPLARTAARAALADAGWSGKDLDRVMKMIDLDEVDVDDDGEVTGIAEQIDGIKADIPEWFRGGRNGGTATVTRRSGGARDVDGGDRATKSTGQSKGWLGQMEDQFRQGG